MRHLLGKDLRILGRSPLLVGLLVVYPLVVALLIGFALTRGPEKPRVALANEVPESASTINLGGEEINIGDYADELFAAVEPVEVDSREEALERVRSGDVLGALVIPEDATRRLQEAINLGSVGGEPPQVEVIVNTEGPLQGAFVNSLIQTQLSQANAALSERATEAAVESLEILLSGGSFGVLGQSVDILGLQRSIQVLEGVQQSLPENDLQRAAVEQVQDFAQLAVDNLDFTDEVLSTINAPVQVETTRLEGGAATTLDDFTVAVAVSVSLMFVCLLLAAGMLALEREENAFGRLVRGLVSRLGVVLEKVALAALCGGAVGGIMLVGLAVFLGLDFARAPAWLAALALASLAFGALGVLVGALARDVRAASLLAFLLSLPLAFLALVPPGAVSGVLGTVIDVVSAIFPFAPTLEAVQASIAGGALLAPLAHLAVLLVAFTALGRLALARFGTA
ncbi:MAG TPA: ABC transporter permease [Solirubrobacteraceae bacterium]|nr:ABC transporter permease [Solirubrobacteraceae bacterium]